MKFAITALPDDNIFEELAERSPINAAVAAAAVAKDILVTTSGAVPVARVVIDPRAYASRCWPSWGA
jgi:hypothetical protein